VGADPRDWTADESTWVSLSTRRPATPPPLMGAIWRALTINERRLARALAVLTAPLYSEETAIAVGIRRASIGKALESLVANADVIHEHDTSRLTDAMFELRLGMRGLTPAGGDDDEVEYPFL
jgi:hypothetical protein